MATTYSGPGCYYSRSTKTPLLPLKIAGNYRHNQSQSWLGEIKDSAYILYVDFTRIAQKCDLAALSRSDFRTAFLCSDVHTCMHAPWFIPCAPAVSSLRTATGITNKPAVRVLHGVVQGCDYPSCYAGMDAGQKNLRP